VENGILKQIGINGQRFEFYSPPLLPRRASESQPVLWVQQNRAVFMKDFTATLLAIVFVLYALIVLLSVEITPDGTSSLLISNQERISEVGLRFAFKR
jgi:hypothetical protein